MWWFWILLLFLLSLVLFNTIYSIIKERQFFKEKKIYHFGNGVILFWKNFVFGKKPFLEVLQLKYEEMKREGIAIGGTTEMGLPAYTVKDLELLKHICVKDFDHFTNRRDFRLGESDELGAHMLNFLSDEKWKNLRSKISPVFTTGKIKRMFQLFDQSSKKLVKFFEREMEASNGGEIDLMEGYSKLTMDTIASIACGMDSQAFEQKGLSVFEQFGKKLQFQLRAKDMIRFLIMSQFPKLAEKLDLTLFGRDTNAFFSGAIKESIRRRKETDEKPNDFIQLMLEAREGKLKVEEGELNSFEKDAVIKDKLASTNLEELLNDDVIVSNCVVFFLAGFETTQSLLIFCAYALAIHPEIQETLKEEIDRSLEENGGKFTYESLHKMTYLDMVINETLRLYPPSIQTDRGVTKDYQLPGTDITLRKGDGILIPIFPMHRDPDLYTNPEKFDPLRFSPENKGKIHPYAFLPFGHGPRNCIAMRFALTEVKLAIVHIVHNFSLQPSKKTLIPMVFENVASLKPKGGMWLALKKLNN